MRQLNGHRLMILQFPGKDSKNWTVAVATIVDYLSGLVLPNTPTNHRTDEPAALAGFRRDFYHCLNRRADALFELVDAVLCTEGPVTSLVGPSLTAEHRRDHGALNDAINSGRINIARLRLKLASLPLPRMTDGRIVLAVDVSSWLRPGRGDLTGPPVLPRLRPRQRPGPADPRLAVLVRRRTGTSHTSWTAILDAVLLGPTDDVTAVTAQQLRNIVDQLISAGHWHSGDPNIVIVMDAGYDVTRLAYVLADLPVELVDRIRADRVLRLPKPIRTAGTNVRPPKHGPEFRLNSPTTWPPAQHTTMTETSRYGTAHANSWNRLHPKLTRRTCWLDHNGDLPIIEGTLIRLQVEHLPGDRDPNPVWLWSSAATATGIDRQWQSFLRRFGLEHTFRLFKQTLGWTRPKIRRPRAADRWTWLIITAHTQLRLARRLTADLRHPWEKPAPPGHLTPARVRRGFRNIRPNLALPAAAPKPTTPGQDDHPEPATETPHPATTWGKPSNGT